MKGRISKNFFPLQHHHLTITPTQITGDKWIKQFITHILNITHLRWIYHNFSLHNCQNGYLRGKQQDSILLEIENLMETQPDEVPSESKFLPEFDLGKPGQVKLDSQQYWVEAVCAS